MAKSPGKAKKQTIGAPVAPTPAAAEPAPSVIDALFATGDSVLHQTFGKGTVVGIDGDKLEIAFKTVGTKKIVRSFVRHG